MIWRFDKPVLKPEESSSSSDSAWYAPPWISYTSEMSEGSISSRSTVGTAFDAGSSNSATGSRIVEAALRVDEEARAGARVAADVEAALRVDEEVRAGARVDAPILDPAEVRARPEAPVDIEGVIPAVRAVEVADEVRMEAAEGTAVVEKVDVDKQAIWPCLESC
jgi:hypothetical protein